MQNNLSEIEKLKNNSTANTNLAMKAYSEKNYKMALECFEKAIKDLTSLQEKLDNNIGGARSAFDDIKSEISSTEQKTIEILTAIGDEFFEKEDYIVAIESYKKILQLSPNDWALFAKIGDCLKRIELYDLAIEFLNESLKINPNNARCFMLLGHIYAKGLNDPANAISYFKKYLEIEPKSANVLNIVGNLYKTISKTENIEEQIKYFKKAIELKPDFTGALRNLGIVYYLNSGYEREAIECFQELFEHNPIRDDYFVYSCLQIKVGNWEEGWKHYESRFDKCFEQAIYPQIDKLRWDGQSITDKTLLVQYEQGFGDSICFFRYLEQIKPLVKKMIFRVQDTLVDLFKNTEKEIEIVGMTTPIDELSFDYHIPLMSLPMVLNARVDNIPLSQGYIKPDIDKVSKYKNEFFDNDCFKIGISWNGMKYGNKLRNIPLETFYPLTQMKNVKVYSFQKGVGSEQLEKLPPEIEIIDLSETFNDFNDTAAAMANIDLFVTSDNGVFNLAAAMGKKTYLMLNQNAEWRWMLDDKTTPWYDSVRIFKKRNEKDSWELIIQRIMDEIKNEI